MPTTNNQPPLEGASVLADDHSEVGRLIHELLAALEKEDRARSFARLDLVWARLAVHIRAEHLCLFPSIRNARRATFTGSDGAPQFAEAHSAIAQLRHDHDFFMRELATAINMMREHEAASDPGVLSQLLREVRRIVVSVETRLKTHNQLEEDQVYRWMDLLLDDAERFALTARMRRELENIPPRFHDV